MKEKTLRLKTSLRIVIIILLFSIGITNLFAEHVEPSVARNVASTFLRNNGAKSEQLTDVSAKAGFSNLYIFNGENGFVIVAADDRVKPILGYSLTDRFVTENMPENLRFWFQGYNDEIQYAIDNQIRTSEETAYEWDELKKGKPNVAKTTVVVEPLIQTHWDQSPGYNDMCPYDDYEGERAVTGCVATAMAQIMKYWEYPSNGSGWHGYIPETHPEYGEQYVNFGASMYDWNSMPLNSSNYEVAKLMYHCGVSVNMDYDIANNGGSGAYSVDIPYSLNKYFGYQNAIVREKSSYTDYNWIQMLKNELDANIPIQYNGEGDNGAHAFICDGYDNQNYFHFNWGWSGANDAYYALTNLVPGSGGVGGGSYNFTNNQFAIFGIQPGSFWIEHVIIGGLVYSLDESNYEAVIIGHKDGSSATGDIVIPSSVTYSDEDGQTHDYIVVAIEERAFYGCIGLTSVTIGDNIETIEDDAFSGCGDLTLYWNAINVPSYLTYKFNNCTSLSLVLSDNVKTVSNDAFSNCSWLTSLTIGESVNSIGDYAFSGCSGLTSLTIPNSVTRIGYSAFSECSGLATVTIGNSVETIYNYAFEDCSNLSTIYWNAVHASYIGLLSFITPEPFGNCTSLATVVFGNSVQSIPENAFYESSSLTSITFGNSVTVIGDNAFYGCSALTGSLTIPNSVTTIGHSAFSGCSGFNGSLTLPNSLTTIGDYAFDGCSGFTGSLTLPNSLKTISIYAFDGCSGFNGSLTLPNALTTIEEAAFEGCSGFTGTLTIPNTVTTIEKSAFRNCNALNTVCWNAENVTNYPTSTSTYQNPFNGCNGLTTVVFGNSVQSIPAKAFYGCSSITSLTIGNSVSTIGNSAFTDCLNLKTVYWNAVDVTSYPSYSYFNDYLPFTYCSSLETVEFGSSVLTIPAYAFYGRSSLTGSLTIPNTITSIGNNAFYNCSGIDAVYYTGNIEEWCSISFENHFSNPLLCAHNLYIDNELLTSLVIPETLTEIKDYTFYNCSSMTDLSIPNTITSIGYCAFYQCEGLSGCLNIPNSVTDIGDDAFYGCSELTSVVLPTSLETINSYTFGDCTGLTALTIPNSVIDIDNCAFYRCTGLNYIRIECPEPPTLNQYAFYGVDKSIPVFVPCGTQEDYISADYWSEFENINESQYNLVISQNDELGGNISVLKYADCEDNHCAIYAEPNIGYDFAGWYINDEYYTVEQFVDFTLTEDVAFEARFVRQEYHEVATGASTIWSNPLTWDNGEVPTSTSTVGIRNNVVVDIDATVESLGVYDNSVLTIQPGVTLTVNDTLGSINESSIVIEDGGQLVHSSKEALATLKKSIEPYTSDDDGWSLISFPLTGNGTIVSVENMLSNQYDLYYYDEPSYTWINQKDEANGFTELEAGKGYLYANLGTGVGAQGAKIGNGSQTTAFTPFHTNWKYSIAENLFLASELETAGLPTTELSSICWCATNQTGLEQSNISIWMANVDDNELTSTSHIVSDMTLVYTGAMTPVIGWNAFVFNENTFSWDGKSNVLVCVQRNNGVYNGSIYWQSHDPGFTAMSYKYNDNNAYDMASETYSMTTSSTLRPNTIFQTVEQFGQFESYEPITMSFAGEIENGTAEVTVPLSYTGGNNLSGFNLVGNPFVHNVTSYETTNVADGCFRVNDAKTNLIVSSISEENPLKPAEGFFVKATGGNASVTFNSPTRKAEDNRGLIRLEIVESGKIVDRLIVKKDGEPLKKISLQGRHTELFARNNENGRLSIVSLEGDEQPVNFKAARMGSYIITANIENLDLDYLHLIDNLTGKNIDLLLDKEYTFYSSTDDNESRFRLIFNPNALVEDDEIFAYQYGDDIIVNGNGTLQVFDVLGRFIANYQINGDDRVSKPSPGVYILRMIGENMKTQKIIVK